MARTRAIAIAIAILFCIGVIGVGAAFQARKHQADVAAEAQRARVMAEQGAARASYRRLNDILSRANGALDRLNELRTTYDGKYSEAADASQKRHDLFEAQPYDVAGGLTLIEREKSAVEALQPMTGEKADAAPLLPAPSTRRTEMALRRQSSMTYRSPLKPKVQA